MKNTLNRNYTDGLKIISAILVMFGHYASFSISQNWSDSFLWNIIASNCGYIGVAIFFFLSGYGLMESEQRHHLKSKDFISKRFLKIYKPILFITFLWLIFEIVFLDKIVSANILYSFFWGFDDCVLWFVKILFGLYFAFFLFTKLRTKGYLKTGILLLITCSLILMYCAHILEGYSSIAIPCFIIGVFYSLYKNKTIITIILIFLAISGRIYTLLSGDNHGLHACINYLIIMFIILLEKRFKSISPIKCLSLSSLSAISFDIYLIHYKILDASVNLNYNFARGVILFALLTFTISIVSNLVRKFLNI